MARLTGSKRRKKQSEVAVARNKAIAEQLAKSQKKTREKTAKQNQSRGVANPTSLGGGGTSKSKTATDKAAWLKKTRNSPAAKAGISDDMRWNAYQKNKKRLKV